jgi:hypothetical protein
MHTATAKAMITMEKQGAMDGEAISPRPTHPPGEIRDQGIR